FSKGSVGFNAGIGIMVDPNAFYVSLQLQQNSFNRQTGPFNLPLQRSFLKHFFVFHNYPQVQVGQCYAAIVGGYTCGGIIIEVTGDPADPCSKGAVGGEVLQISGKIGVEPEFS